MAGGLLLSGWFYRVRGRSAQFFPDAVVTPLGRFTFDRTLNVVRAETSNGKFDFQAKSPVSILVVPSAKRVFLGEIGPTDLSPAFRDSLLTLTIGLRSEGRFLPLLALSQYRVSEDGADPLHLTLVRTLRLARDINDVAMEMRASCIEAFRAMGLTVHFDESV